MSLNDRVKRNKNEGSSHGEDNNIVNEYIAIGDVLIAIASDDVKGLLPLLCIRAVAVLL